MPKTFKQVIRTPNIAWDKLSDEDCNLLQSYKDELASQFISMLSVEDQLTFILLVMEAEGI